MYQFDRYITTILQGVKFRFRDFAILLGLVALMTATLALPYAAQARVLPALEINASGASTAGVTTGVNSLTVTMVNNPNNPNDNVYSVGFSSFAGRTLA